MTQIASTQESSTHVSTTPARARTDVGAPVSAAGGPSTATVRRLALGLSAGAFTWAVGSFAYGFAPTNETGVKISDLTGLAFQLGLWSLLTLQRRTRATGVTRAARAMFLVEHVLLTLAMAWTLVHALVPAARGTLWLGVLDLFWPLSMMGMFVIGVKIALAGRWRGAARVWPLVAESWVVVTLPVLAVFGHQAGDLVGSSHLLVGYTTLGLLVAARPALVLDRG
ncbi:hypothetical protein [Nocardioides mesophilus]|uniref:Uncharacterized protein n=1 Tax=Nocardioides mesophilus TaxID=433659 RepID=A0A7G9R6P8_9ACTN|nr:hypothetical protein [Nocardioides mesophilus]QNN51273.1 hypothetical protein H9L09_11580 [Nocardioides mesophilus]